MDGLVEPITFDAFGPLNSAYIWRMTSFPAVFALGNTRVHVGTMNSGNKTSDIEPPIDEALYFHAALCVPYVNPNDCSSNHSPERHLWYADFSKALSRLSSSGDYKRTRQGALTVLILYIYYRLLVHATTIITCPYVHASSSCSITKATMPYTCALTLYS